MDPFRSEAPKRALDRLCRENAALRAELVTLEELERAQRSCWARWGETPEAAERTLRWVVVLAVALALAVGSLVVGLMGKIVSCAAGPGLS